MTRLMHFLGSVAYTGFFPFAPATFTSFVLALLFYWWAPGTAALGITLAITLLVSIPVASRMELDLGKDPKPCTIDELAGFLLALFLLALTSGHEGVAVADPVTRAKLLAAAFFLFRFFDISKLPPGKQFEGFPGGWGIVADDLVAGFYTFLCLLAYDLWILH